MCTSYRRFLKKCVLGKAVLCMLSTTLGQEHFLSKRQTVLPQAVLDLLPCVGMPFTISDRMCTPLFCLRVVWHLVNPTTICLLWGEDEVLHSVAQEGNVQANGSASSAASLGGPMPTIEANLALFFLYSKVLFWPVLYCTVFALVTLIPRCRGQRCLDFYSR